MTNPEIQALVVDIVQIQLRLLKVQDKQVTEFLEIIVELEIEELHKLQALNEAH